MSDIFADAPAATTFANPDTMVTEVSEAGTDLPRGGRKVGFSRRIAQLNPTQDKLASNNQWDDVFTSLDNMKAGVNDFNEVRTERNVTLHTGSTLDHSRSRADPCSFAFTGNAPTPHPQHGKTLMHLAAQQGAVDAIDELMHRGANVDAMTKTASCNQRTQTRPRDDQTQSPMCDQGYTALHCAAEDQRFDAVKRLVHHGANLWAMNWVRTATHTCAATTGLH